MPTYRNHRDYLMNTASAIAIGRVLYLDALEKARAKEAEERSRRA